MAKVVAELPKGSGRYDDKYGKYFDGQVWALEPSDYAPTTTRLAQCYFTAVAKTKGLTVKTRFVDGVLYVQAIKNGHV